MNLWLLKFLFIKIHCRQQWNPILLLHHAKQSTLRSNSTKHWWNAALFAENCMLRSNYCHFPVLFQFRSSSFFCFHFWFTKCYHKIKLIFFFFSSIFVFAFSFLLVFRKLWLYVRICCVNPDTCTDGNDKFIKRDVSAADSHFYSIFKFHARFFYLKWLYWDNETKERIAKKRHYSTIRNFKV